MVIDLEQQKQDKNSK